VDHYSLQSFKKIHQRLHGQGHEQLAKKFYKSHIKKYNKNKKMKDSAGEYLARHKKSNQTAKAPGFWKRRSEKKQAARKEKEVRSYAAYRIKAIDAFKRAKYIQCRKWCRKMIRLEPKVGDAYNLLGVTYKKEGRTTRSVKEYEKGLKGDPNCVKLLHNLSIAYAQLGNKERSKRLYLKAQSLGGERGVPVRRSRTKTNNVA
jgi:tetratricopeptide (TPR) repeat protein